MAPRPAFEKRPHAYQAHGATHTYLVYRSTASRKKTWLLEVRKTITVAGLQIGDSQQTVRTESYDLKREAEQVARNFEALGDDFVEARHGGKSRFTVAHLAMYDNTVV